MINPLSQLHQFIITHYGIEDLRTLCFRLGLPYDELGGEGLSGRTRELLLHLGRRQAFKRLLDALCQDRPKAFDAAGLWSFSPSLPAPYAGNLALWRERQVGREMKEDSHETTLYHL